MPRCCTTPTCFSMDHDRNHGASDTPPYEFRGRRVHTFRRPWNTQRASQPLPKKSHARPKFTNLTKKRSSRIDFRARREWPSGSPGRFEPFISAQQGPRRVPQREGVVTNRTQPPDHSAIMGSGSDHLGCWLPALSRYKKRWRLGEGTCGVGEGGTVGEVTGLPAGRRLARAS